MPSIAGGKGLIKPHTKKINRRDSQGEATSSLWGENQGQFTKDMTPNLALKDKLMQKGEQDMM